MITWLASLSLSLSFFMCVQGESLIAASAEYLSQFFFLTLRWVPLHEHVHFSLSACAMWRTLALHRCPLSADNEWARECGSEGAQSHSQQEQEMQTRPLDQKALCFHGIFVAYIVIYGMRQCFGTLPSWIYNNAYVAYVVNRACGLGHMHGRSIMVFICGL